MKKRIVITALTVALISMAMPITTIGNPLQKKKAVTENSIIAPTISEDEAKKISAAMLPSGSILIHMENNEESFILKYYAASSKELYSISISAHNGSLQKLETQAYLQSKTKTKNANIKEAAVHKIVSDEIKDVKIANTELEVVDGNSQYVIRFQSPKLYGSYTVNAKDGTIEDRVIKAGIPLSHEATTNYISLSALKNKALNVVRGGIVTDVNIKELNDSVNYQVEVCKGSMQHKLLFNAFTGKLLSQSSQVDGWTDNNYQLAWQYKEYRQFHLLPDNIASDIIDMDKAIAVAKRKAPQGELVSISLYYHNDTGIYEGKLEKGEFEYYFKMDAISGKLLYGGGDY